MEAKRKKRKEFIHIGNVVHNVMQAYRDNSDAGLMQVWQVWNRIVGEAVAKNAQPAAFKGDLLLVHVSSSPWIQQLQFLKQDIISKLNQALAKESVKEIKFKIGPLTE